MYYFPLKLKSFTFGAPIPLARVQSCLNFDHALRPYWLIEDETKKLKVLTFVVIRNVIKLQIFTRAILKMREEAASKIKKILKQIKQDKEANNLIEQKVDQLNYKNSIRII
jgi:hypothetical protein